jgi:hypothetical protein
MDYLLTLEQWFSQILDAVDFPFVLPVGDLSRYIKGRNEKTLLKEMA